MEDAHPRKLQRGLKDISELFREPAELPGSAGKKPVHTIGLFDPLSGDASLSMGKALAEILSAKGRNAAVFFNEKGRIRSYPSSLEGGAGLPDVPLFLFSATDLSMTTMGRNGLHASDVLILLLDGQAEGVKEAYRALKNFRNAPGIYMLFTENCSEERAIFIYEWFSSYLLEKLQLSADWLGCLASTTPAGIAARLENIPFSFVRLEHPAKAALVQAFLRQMPEAAGAAP